MTVELILDENPRQVISPKFRERTISAYHYTNPEAYRSMLDGRVYREKMLLPIKRVLNLGIKADDPDAHEGAIFCLSEPEPESWLRSTEFPNIWAYLAGDLCKSKNLLLLKVELTPRDRAFFIDRAHVERELYKDENRPGSRILLNQAYNRYWHSRIPVFDYKYEHVLPEIIVLDPISPERLEVIMKCKSDDFFKRAMWKSGGRK